MVETIDILGKISRTQYEALIQFAVSVSSCLSVVVRDYNQLNHHGLAFLEKLEPYLIRKTETSSWPGTELYHAVATVLYYRCDMNIYDLLITPKNIYHWQHPDFPEDLSFYMANGQVWFGSIAHEHDVFFVSGFFTKQDILSNAPGLRLAKRGYSINSE